MHKISATFLLIINFNLVWIKSPELLLAISNRNVLEMLCLLPILSNLKISLFGHPVEIDQPAAPCNYRQIQSQKQRNEKYVYREN